jgi:deoxyribonuclease-4
VAIAEGRHFGTIAWLWDRIEDTGIGFCPDTFHAWAAGEQLIDAVDRIKAITGRIDTGAMQRLATDLLLAVVKAAGAPVICETTDEGRRSDIAFLRDNL